MDNVRVHLIVEGRVQRVWYRDSTRQMANKLGVKGWVRNKSDGNVEMVAEGPEDAVQRLIAWCKEGPPNAFVTGVIETPEDFLDEFDSFNIVF